MSCGLAHVWLPEFFWHCYPPLIVLHVTEALTSSPPPPTRCRRQILEYSPRIPYRRSYSYKYLSLIVRQKERYRSACSHRRRPPPGPTTLATSQDPLSRPTPPPTALSSVHLQRSHIQRTRFNHSSSLVISSSRPPTASSARAPPSLAPPAASPSAFPNPRN